MSPSPASAIAQLLGALGIRDKSILAESPVRTAKLWQELLRGYNTDPVALVQKDLQPVTGSSMVIVSDIVFHSVCAHHLLPFFGHVHVGYIPGKHMIGLGKIARVVDALAHRLQMQEALTQEIADALQRGLGAKGVCVVIEADHLCLQIRGAKKTHARTTTIAGTKKLARSGSARREFLAVLSAQAAKAKSGRS